MLSLQMVTKSVKIRTNLCDGHVDPSRQHTLDVFKEYVGGATRNMRNLGNTVV